MQGVLDMLHHGGGAKILPVVPQLILPLKCTFAAMPVLSSLLAIVDVLMNALGPGIEFRQCANLDNPLSLML